MKKKIVRIYKYEENKNSYKTLIDKIISISLCTKNIEKWTNALLYLYISHLHITHFASNNFNTSTDLIVVESA